MVDVTGAQDEPAEEFNKLDESTGPESVKVELGSLPPQGLAGLAPGGTDQKQPEDPMKKTPQDPVTPSFSTTVQVVADLDPALLQSDADFDEGEGDEI